MLFEDEWHQICRQRPNKGTKSNIRTVVALHFDILTEIEKLKLICSFVDKNAIGLFSILSGIEEVTEAYSRGLSSPDLFMHLCGGRQSSE